MPAFSVFVYRTQKDQGVLNYFGSFNGTFTCWWDPKDAIPTGKFSLCSKTYLTDAVNSKGQKREGIFIPGVPNRSGIFIHYWPGPGANLSVWSDGCVLMKEADLLKIWNDITPLNGRNVTVSVSELVVPVAPGPLPEQYPSIY